MNKLKTTKELREEAYTLITGLSILESRNVITKTLNLLESLLDNYVIIPKHKFESIIKFKEYRGALEELTSTLNIIGSININSGLRVPDTDEYLSRESTVDRVHKQKIIENIQQFLEEEQ